MDPRVGSKDLLHPLQMQGVPAELSPVDMVAGDFAFIGRGIDNEDVYIGVELKVTTDLISCLYSGRFTSEQIPKLQTLYGHHVWLLTEGIWRAGDGGVLEHIYRGQWRQATVGARAIMARDVDSWILTQVIKGGFHHHHAATRQDTIRFLSVLYHWWSSKSLDEHRSHQAIYIAPPDRVLISQPSRFRKMMSCLEKIGWDRGLALETWAGGDFDRLMAGTVEEFAGIDGIGKSTAASIYQFLHPARTP